MTDNQVIDENVPDSQIVDEDINIVNVNDEAENDMQAESIDITSEKTIEDAATQKVVIEEENVEEISEEACAKKATEEFAEESAQSTESPQTNIQSDMSEANAIYSAFMDILCKSLQRPRTPEDIAASFALAKTQVNTWLKKAEKEKKIVKLTQPIRYVIPEGRSLFLL